MKDADLLAFDQAKKLIIKASNILVISHKAPDGDTIGANLAMNEALTNLGKNVISACIDEVPTNCLFLKGALDFKRDFNPDDFDLVIAVDCGGYKLTGFTGKQGFLEKTKNKLINIDHHPSNDNFGTVNIVMTDAPSTCFILFLMLSYYGIKIESNMATALLHGLYYDTGSFMHANTTADALRIAGRLKALGANHEKSIKEQFHTASIQKLKLWGKALNRATLNSKNAVFSVITNKDIKETASKNEDVSGLINYLNHVPAKFCMLLTETADGQIKASLRTQEQNIDLTQIAELFGGGGHKKASGFTIKGQIKEKTVWAIE